MWSQSLRKDHRQKKRQVKALSLLVVPQQAEAEEEHSASEAQREWNAGAA